MTFRRRSLSHVTDQTSVNEGQTFSFRFISSAILNISAKSSTLPHKVIKFRDDRFFEFVKVFSTEELVTLLEF
jgi:hypothetical protein